MGLKYCRVCLDHALMSDEWSKWFPFGPPCHLIAIKLDHSPIQLLNDFEAYNRRIAIARPFLYKVMWEHHNEFVGLLKKDWNSQTKSSTFIELR